MRSSNLDYRDLLSVENELQQMKDFILNQSITWRSVGEKVLTIDGDFTDGTDVDIDIRALIEPVGMATSQVQKIIQGLAENSSHVLMTLKNYDIKEEDIIINSVRRNWIFPIILGTKTKGNYRVNYVIPSQFDIDYSIYLLKIDNN